VIGFVHVHGVRLEPGAAKQQHLVNGEHSRHVETGGKRTWGGEGTLRRRIFGAVRDGVCVCGHDRSAHEHYRAGTDCALCESCNRFRPARSRRWKWRWLLFRR
jgi:hypothetical protein